MRQRYISRSSIPEIQEAVERYGVSLRKKPIYVVVGYIDRPDARSAAGPIGFTSHKFHAEIIRSVAKKHGYATVERTEFHPDGATFHIGAHWNSLSPSNA